MTVPDLATTQRAFLFADPAAHSLSPRMHGAAFTHAGLPGTYEARRVPTGELASAVAGLRAPGVLGANLSLPHKEAVVPLLDSLSDAARAVGAVNTVIHRDGQLHGENTDAPGLLAALRDAGLPDLGPGEPVVILGAGGAARAAAFVALRDLGARAWIVNRTLDRARALAAAFRPHGEVQAAAPDDVPWADTPLVINASSAGLNDPEQTPLDASFLARLPAGALVYDMVYKPAETRLMREARALGLNAENGLGMLAHQARLAFTAWTGADVPVRVFLDALGEDAGSGSGAGRTP
ncbi:shikimate dehydrogenase [Deinococcus soli (ex Cha et al. 2016)]|uniref:shikimate dehydrogenase n=1 Tax=Deinococcus soli (ex Cha et al. 2016) TaxID=1309411 RepID=UPI001995E866|nr:shikimate dehydrogenase [Deinococcus soli (ex Cha et al. 2016)]GGB57039.1 shikimate dehydrogenase (NADP(+)) [Deinococcus soli (ex Cha et al. 2016)]